MSKAYMSVYPKAVLQPRAEGLGSNLTIPPHHPSLTGAHPCRKLPGTYPPPTSGTDGTVHQV